MSLESNKTRKVICQEKVCHVCCFVDRSSGWTMLHRKRRVIIWQSTFNAVRTIFFPFATPPMSVMRWVMRNRNPGHGYTLCRNDAIQDIHQKILAGGWGSSRQTSIKWCTNSGWYNCHRWKLYIQRRKPWQCFDVAKEASPFLACKRQMKSLLLNIRFFIWCLQALVKALHNRMHLLFRGHCWQRVDVHQLQMEYPSLRTCEEARNRWDISNLIISSTETKSKRRGNNSVGRNSDPFSALPSCSLINWRNRLDSVASRTFWRSEATSRHLVRKNVHPCRKLQWTPYLATQRHQISDSEAVVQIGGDLVAFPVSAVLHVFCLQGHQLERPWPHSKCCCFEVSWANTWEEESGHCQWHGLPRHILEFQSSSTGAQSPPRHPSRCWRFPTLRWASYIFLAALAILSQAEKPSNCATRKMSIRTPQMPNMHGAHVAPETSASFSTTVLS